MNFNALYIVVATLTVLLAVGFLSRKVGIIDDVASKRLSKLILMVGQPAMIIHSMSNAEYSDETVSVALVMLGLGFVFHGLLAALGFIFALPYKRVPDEKKISEFSFMFANCAFIGFPILDAVFPENGSFFGAFFVIGFHVYIWTLGIFILSKGREDIKLTPKKAIFNYGTVPCAIGLLLYFSQALFKIPAVAVDFCGYVGALCMPIAVLVTGALLATQNARSMLKDKQLYFFNAIKLILIPLVVCLVAKLCTMGLANNYEIVMFCTVISALPSAATITMLATLYDISPGYAAQTVGTSSVLSVGTLPLLYFIADFVARL